MGMQTITVLSYIFLMDSTGMVIFQIISMCNVGEYDKQFCDYLMIITNYMNNDFLFRQHD